MATSDSMVCPICSTAIVPVPAADGLNCYRPVVDVADLQRQLVEARGELATVLAGADADAVLLGNLDRRCQSQQRMIAHLRDRLAKCQEHNRRLAQEAREAYRQVVFVTTRSGKVVLDAEQQLAECQAQAAALREALEAQGRLDDECETCAQAFDCPCFSPADGAECKLWAEVQAKKDAALATDGRGRSHEPIYR